MCEESQQEPVTRTVPAPEVPGFGLTLVVLLTACSCGRQEADPLVVGQTGKLVQIGTGRKLPTAMRLFQAPVSPPPPPHTPVPHISHKVAVPKFSMPVSTSAGINTTNEHPCWVSVTMVSTRAGCHFLTWYFTPSLLSSQCVCPTELTVEKALGRLRTRAWWQLSTLPCDTHGGEAGWRQGCENFLGISGTCGVGAHTGALSLLVALTVRGWNSTVERPSSAGQDGSVGRSQAIPRPY